MHKLGEQNVTGMILDLRGNPGGLVNEAVAVAGRFLRDGQIVVSHRGRAEQEQVFRAKANALAQKYPIVVLVDSRSASAAEIVSGALQDHDRAWILGDTTFGKGLVQAQFPLSEGAALLLTIAHYYTPSGRLIQRDYSHESFFDYYYAKHDGVQNTQDIKTTDSGRKVYGGGGITPDEKYASPALQHVPAARGQLCHRQNAFFHFGNVYFGADKPVLPAGWQPDDDTLDRFKTFLKTAGITFTDDEFDANHDWISDQIRYELYFRAFGSKAANRAQWSNDPEIKKGIESLPRAQSLLQQVQRVLAQRGAPRLAESRSHSRSPRSTNAERLTPPRSGGISLKSPGKEARFPCDFGVYGLPVCSSHWPWPARCWLRRAKSPGPPGLPPRRKSSTKNTRVSSRNTCRTRASPPNWWTTCRPPIPFPHPSSSWAAFPASPAS